MKSVQQSQIRERTKSCLVVEECSAIHVGEIRSTMKDIEVVSTVKDIEVVSKDIKVGSTMKDIEVVSKDIEVSKKKEGYITMKNMYSPLNIIILWSLTIFFCFVLLQASNNYSTMTEKKASNAGKPAWQAKTKGYESCVFFVGKNCAEQYIETMREMCDYIRATHGSDALKSMLTGEIAIEGMEPPIKYKSKAEMELALDFTDALLFMEHVKIYAKKKSIVVQHLGDICSLLYGHCNLSMRAKLAADKEYQKMSMKDSATMYRLIAKISNGSSSVQNPIRQAMGALFNLTCPTFSSCPHCPSCPPCERVPLS